MARAAPAIRYRFVGARARRLQPVVAAVDRLGYALLNRNRAVTPPPQSIGVIQPSGLGDILMTLPVLKLLKDQWGGRIVLAVNPTAVSWLQACTFIDEVLPVDIAALVGRPGAGMADLYRQLRAVKAEAIYEVRGDVRLTGLLRAAHPGARIGGFACGGGGFLLDRALDYDLNDHISKMYNALAGEVGIGAPPLDHWNPAWTPIETPPPGLPPQFAAVHIGTGARSKQWPRDRFIQLIRALAKDRAVVVLGGPGDLSEAMSAAITATPGVHDRIGRLTFGQTLGVIAASSLYIGQDTGATHGAAYLGKPYVALYSGFDNQRFMPALLYEGQGVALQNRPACSGEHGCARTDCLDNVCMTSITVDAVLAAAKTLDASARLRSRSPLARGTSSLPPAEAVQFSTIQCRDL